MEGDTIVESPRLLRMIQAGISISQTVLHPEKPRRRRRWSLTGVIAALGDQAFKNIEDFNPITIPLIFEMTFSHGSQSLKLTHK
jgi:hypothetical protein